MIAKKEELKRRLSEVDRIAGEALEKARIKWLNKVCREARDSFGFNSVGELIMFLADHASSIQPVSTGSSETSR